MSAPAPLAYKFLRPGAVGPFSGFRWPCPAHGEPGEWVEAAGGSGLCEAGVHACERRHLPLWIWEELWEVELEGPLERGIAKLCARRGRLLRRVERWSPRSAKDLAVACARRAAEHAATATGADAEVVAGMAADGDARARAAEASADLYVAAHGAAVSAYIAAMTALRAGGGDALSAERAWQAEWLARELELGV
ncbi:MAG TPA: hypothetical protein VH703_01725 [Solirubrobacterales bacterium]|jgi:hypothetical protein